jgi:hypothetical protein
MIHIDTSDGRMMMAKTLLVLSVEISPATARRTRT